MSERILGLVIVLLMITVMCAIVAVGWAPENPSNPSNIRGAWERIELEEGNEIWRLKTPHGWAAVSSGGNLNIYVPDPDHVWFEEADGVIELVEEH